MRRFVWRLQRVLGIKTLEEQTKRAQLLGLTEELAQTRGQLLMQKQILKNLIAEIARQKAGRRLGEQEFFLKYSKTTDEKIEQLENKVTGLESKQREKIAEVLKAKRFKEGLEKMRTKAKSQFINEQEKLEQKELDEGAIVGFARKIIQPVETGQFESR